MTTLEAPVRIVQRPKYAVEDLCVLAERPEARLSVDEFGEVIRLIETADGLDPCQGLWEKHLRSASVRASVRSLLGANRPLRSVMLDQAGADPSMSRVVDAFMGADIGVAVVSDELYMRAEDVDDVLRLTENTHLGERLANCLAMVHSGSLTSDVRDEARWLNLGEMVAMEAGRVLDLVREFAAARRVFATVFTEQPFVMLGVRSSIERNHAAFEMPKLLNELGVNT